MKDYTKFIHKIIKLPDLINHYGRVTNVRRTGELLEVTFKWILNIADKQLVLKKGPFTREYTFGIHFNYFLSGTSEMLRMMENQLNEFDHAKNY